jgi:hypothetical protein
MAASMSHGSASRASPTAPTVESSSNLRFADFPTDYATLPRVAFVIPNLNHDMHNGKRAATSKVQEASCALSAWTSENAGHVARSVALALPHALTAASNPTARIFSIFCLLAC